MQAFITVVRALALWCALAVWPPGMAHADDGPLHITQAQFRAAGAPGTQTVALPDTWALRGRPASGQGHYRLHFRLSSPVLQTWALEVERLSESHEVRLNGALVHGTLQAKPPFRRALPVLITLPPALLRVGDNTLDITLSAAASGGLSALTLGPWQPLDAGFQRKLLRHIALPQMANMAAAGISLFMLLIWWRRPTEAAIGSFGALGFLACLRNFAYFAKGAPVPSAWSSWAFMQAAMLTALLLGLFAMALAERRPRWLRAVLWSTLLLFPPLSLWAMFSGVLQTARLWLYPLLLLTVALALGLVGHTAWRRRSASMAVLVAGLVAVAAAGVHDYWFQQGRLPITGEFWLPYAVPAAVAAFAAMLLKRLLMSLESMESMNLVLERKVQERTQTLHSANAAQTRFLAAASHDLRQPMVSIGLLVGLMDEQVGPGALRRVVQRLKEATGAMESLLTRLLDLSRLQSGTVRVQRQPLAMAAVLGDVQAQHTEQAQAKGLRLRVRPGRAVVSSDLALLQQIVGNLVGNAVRYTRQGGVLVGVRPAGPAHWRLAVWDTGPGIEPAAQALIFGEFVRGPGASEGSATGLGLGLAIAQRAAVLLGAEVTLRSVPGRGSCFSLRLPRAGGAAAPVALPPAPAQQPLACPLAGRRLWLLEDDPIARAATQMLLVHWGAEVETFSSLASLRAADCQSAAPDLFISDMRLGDGQGTQAVQHLREHWPRLAAVFVTGNTAPEDLAALERWREAGIPVLIKPYSGQALLAAVLPLLAGATA